MQTCEAVQSHCGSKRCEDGDHLSLLSAFNQWKKHQHQKASYWSQYVPVSQKTLVLMQLVCPWCCQLVPLVLLCQVFASQNGLNHAALEKAAETSSLNLSELMTADAVGEHLLQ